MGRWKLVLGWALALGGAALLVYYSFRSVTVTGPAKVAGLELAAVAHADPAPRAGLPRITVTASGVKVDQDALSEGAMDERGCTPSAVAAVHRRLPVGATPGEMLDRPLASVLDGLYSALGARGRCGGPNGFDGSIELDVDASVPYRRVASLVYTAAMARFGRFYFRVRTPSGDGSLRVDGPRICSGGAPAPPATPKPVADGGVKPKAASLLAILGKGGGSPCVTPFIGIGGPGIDVRPMYSRPTGCSLGFGLAPAPAGGRTPVDGGTPGDAGASAAGPEWSARILSGRDGGCPSVARREGHLDMGQLAAILQDLARHARVCRHVAIAPAPATPWSEVAAVLAVAEPGHEPALLGPLAPNVAPRSTCSQAIRIDAVHLPGPPAGR